MFTIVLNYAGLLQVKLSRLVVSPFVAQGLELLESQVVLGNKIANCSIACCLFTKT